MTKLFYLVGRNTRIFFRDKGTFFSALIAPLIVLGLYVLFLGNIFTSSFESAIAGLVEVPDAVINGFVAVEEISSILATSTVTVAFIASMIMVQDRVNNALSDIMVSPVKPSVLAISYYISTVIVTLIVCYCALAVGFVYIAIAGWFISTADALLIVLDVFIMCLFGTALSSIISFFLKSQGGMSAVGTIISSVYGFICGAYFPISQFATGIQNIVMCLPCTYGTGLFRNHFLNGVIEEMSTEYHFPDEVISGIRKSFDVDLFFFEKPVSVGVMYGVVLGSILVLLGIYVLLNVLKKRKKS